MSILTPAKHVADFCDKHDLYEYGLFIMVTMSDGYSFITQDTDLANKFIAEHGAQTRHIVEFGE